MEHVQQASTTSGLIFKLRRKFGLRDRVSEGIKKDLENMEKDLAVQELNKLTKDNSSKWRIPMKTQMTLNKSTKKVSFDKILFFYFNCKNGECEPPILLPQYGNMVIYRHKVYKLNPKAIWNLRWGLFGKIYKGYFYKDYDRRPISAEDYNQVVLSGNSTEDDDLLIKAALSAKLSPIMGQINMKALLIGGLILVGIIIWLFSRGG
jgi:hypothetical protein